jgi:Tol biopolymer transport system component
MSRTPTRSAELWRWWVPATLAFGLLALGCDGGSDCPSADPMAPGCAAPDVAAPPLSVVFQSNRAGPVEVFTMNADGSGVTRLTNNPGVDGGARWSPDGSRIAFSSLRQGSREIWVMNADGTDQRKLTSLGVATNMPDWSPAGDRIAFHASRGDGNWDIYVMNADGSGIQRITSANSHVRPRWSPDGMSILVQWFEDTAPCACVGSLPVCPCDGRLAVMNPDGSNLKLLPRIGLDDGWGEWSPDGRRIVFASYRSSGPGIPARQQIMVMNASGSSARTLTTGMMDEWSPAWSSATGRIYYVSAFTIFSMRADGNDARRLTAGMVNDVVVHSR